MSDTPNTTDTPEPVNVDQFVAWAQQRLVTTIDDEIAKLRDYRANANIRIKELLAEKARLERIVRASQPRKRKPSR